MYKLFTKKAVSNNSVIKPPTFEYIQRTYQRELAKIVEYYNTRVYAVQSNHLLCRILTTGYVPVQYPLDRFMEVAYTRSPYVAKYFNITSDITYGKFFDGTFYGPGNDEILLYNEDYFNPFDALENWKSLKPITVLEHPVSDFGLLLPNGKDINTAKGLVVVTINLPMLLVMYRGFLQRQGVMQTQEDASHLGVSHFVHMFVLPSMLESHLEIVLLNRVKNLFYSAPMSSSLKHHPFHVINYSDKVDKIALEVIKHLKDKQTLYTQYLKCIPSFYKEDMQEFLLMPDMAKTRQVWWCLLLTRLGTMKFLLDIGEKKGISSNGTYINRLQLDIKQLNRENLISSLLPSDLLYEVKNIFNEIQKL